MDALTALLNLDYTPPTTAVELLLAVDEVTRVIAAVEARQYDASSRREAALDPSGDPDGVAAAECDLDETEAALIRLEPIAADLRERLADICRPPQPTADHATDDTEGRSPAMFNFLTLRPSAPTATAIAEALDRARAAVGEAQRAMVDAKARRDGMLLDGAPKDIVAAEKDFAAARDDAERAEVMAAQLGERLAAARRTETIRDIADARDKATAAAQAMVRWHDVELPKLHALIVQGKRLARESEDTYRAWDRAVEAEFGPFGSTGQERPEGVTNEVGTWKDRMLSELRA